jgi:hypothetical protein
VLVWDPLPRSAGDAPALVLGQPDMSSVEQNQGGLSARSLYFPWNLHTDGTRLFVADYYNHRLLIWNSLPTASHQPADLVLGQPDMQTGAPNQGGLSARSLNGPNGVFSDGTRLFVSDAENHRVLIWSQLPTANHQPADLVLGQPNMTSNTQNQGGLSARSLSYPIGLASDGTRLYLAENNGRVLIWNQIPTMNQQPADLVLGQPSMTVRTTGPVSARGPFLPVSVHVHRGRLYVVDVDNHRVLYWNAPPTMNEQPADGVIGQPDAENSLANNGGLGPHRLHWPGYVWASTDTLYIAEWGNNRLLARPIP